MLTDVRLVAAAALGAAAVLSGCATTQQAPAYTTETLVLREISLKTYAGTLNDDADHPVMQIDNLDKPRPIGPGRGAGTWVFINNKLVDYEDGADVGVMRGYCWTIDHGPNGPYTGALWIGEGGPYHSACQFSYVMADGYVIATGDMDMEQVENDRPGTLGIIGGTGRYRGARGEVTIRQDPPGQPITYKLVISVDILPPVQESDDAA